MPKIHDASQFKLTELIHQLSMNPSSPNDKKELRSTGRDLYVKTGQTGVTWEWKRTKHRDNAAKLVRDSLAREYGCKPEEAEQIMKDVFGEVPVPMTANKTRELYEIGTLARNLAKEDLPLPQAFVSATKTVRDRAGDMDKLIEELKARGLSDQDAFEAACVAQSRPYCTGETAITGALLGLKVVAGETTLIEAKGAMTARNEKPTFADAITNAMRGLPPYEKSDDSAKARWRNLAIAFGARDLLGDVDTLRTGEKSSLLQALSDEMRRLPPYDKSGDAEKATWRHIATALGAWSLVRDAGKPSTSDKSSLLQALSDEMRQLPPYDESGPDRETWLSIANAFAVLDLVAINDLRTLGTNQKASLLQALSQQVITQWRKKDASEIDAAYRSIVWFNQTITLDDVMSSDDMLKIDSFLQKCGNDTVLREAKTRWPNLSNTERETAINRMIALHAEEFVYSVPPDYLKIHSMATGTDGSLSVAGTNMEINSASATFNNFSGVVGVVCHESTHKCQWRLTADLDYRAVGPTSPNYHRERLMNTSQTATIDFSDLVNNRKWPEDTAYLAYRQSPREMQAFYIGDYVKNRIDGLDQ